jgi:NADPH:quinone reductase-like Zn-dependent oxidoreductase
MPSASRTGELIRAWVLRKGADGPKRRGRLEHTTVRLPPLPPDRVLVETLFGSWEANMTHALDRDPIDVCRRLGQDFIVLGNGGVVRVLAVGDDVQGIVAGDTCMFAPVAKQDAHGYVQTVCAYDEPNTMGCLAERFHVRPTQLVPLPDGAGIAPSRWASFAVRYAPAWSNWRVALGAWRLQMPEVPLEKVHVWAWGGGVAYGELLLARAVGCRTVMLHSGQERGEMLLQAGIVPVDRDAFSALWLLASDCRKAQLAKLKAERALLDIVDDLTGGDRVSIFIDNIGGPVAGTTLRALGRQGVVATAGWKHGMNMEFNRATACINRHIIVHTHACPLHDCREAVRYAAQNHWVPPQQKRIYRWEEIEALADDHAAGRIASYFPTFAAPAGET